MTQPRIAGAVLNWNSWRSTLRCLRSVEQSTRSVMPIVVDNASSDSSVDRLVEAIGVDRVLQLPVNTGYAGGMNAGTALLKKLHNPEFLLLLTQDVVLEADALEAMLTAALADPRVGVVGPVIHTRDTPGELFSAGGLLDRRRTLAAHHKKPIRATPYEVDWVDGCCMLIRCDALADLAFDERYFMYFEENDLCQKMRATGARVVVAPEARVSQEKTVVRGEHYFYYMARNSFLFWRKNYDIGASRVIVSLSRDLFWSCVRIFVALLSSESRNDVPVAVREFTRRVSGTIFGVRDALRGRYGYRPFPSSEAT